ncbi:Spx/MgsR family RNA polymerase-binding regulatory protein [Moraxella sp.]|uniref:Spx/MgsR family RNA polymerase-binding regulatory protein n=1 Tax=Moraxella sp. TaxID=479 RepID=UPI0026DD20DE|nr:Spx/MgsR family RNA polymerase-binding regulatory protein [Moraxella sp.]MDO4894133.1 Spx/MgsR family RNA polymerase-binding regulatory protein [Moraxella sp.]
MTITVYGIKNCNTMKKAFDFLGEHKISYEFFDYKKSVLSQADFERFVELFGDKVINKQGTTYRKFDDETKAMLASDDLSVVYQIVKSNQSVLKRPIITGEHHNGAVALIGFDESLYQETLTLK